MPTTITTLPNELLSSIVSHLSPSPCIRNLRLVSRRFNAVSSPYLISSTLVSFTSQSLLDLEELASHPVFSKGVEKVDVDVSYFDKVLASGMGNFVRNAASQLSQDLEWMERASHFRGDSEDTDEESEEDDDDTGELGETSAANEEPKTSDSSGEQHSVVDELSNSLEKLKKKTKKPKVKSSYDYVSEAYGVPIEWTAVYSPGFEKDKASEKQSLILNTYEDYVKLFEDQESAIQNGEGIKRIVKALEKFPVLKTIVLEDNPNLRIKPTLRSANKGRSYADQLSNEGLSDRCLTPSRWKGSFQTAMVTSPPSHFISGLFIALAGTEVQPTRFKIKLTAPANMRCMQFSLQELDAVEKSLGRAEYLEFCMEEWARKGSYA